MAKRWGFYGRDKEKGRIGETFRSPGFELLTIRGRRGVGKTELVNQVVDGFPDDIQVFWYTFAKNITLSDLRDEMYETAEASGLPAPRGADGRAPLRGISVLLKDLLERGVIVVLDEAQFLMSHELEDVTWKIKTLAEDLRRDFKRGASGQGTLVLMGSAQQQMEAMFAGNRAALSTSKHRIMALEPWPVSTLLAVADEHGWLERPGRFLTLWTAFGGVPRYWEEFSATSAADFSAWEDDGDWRLAFAHGLVEDIAPGWNSHMTAMMREFTPVNRHLLHYLASANANRTGFGDIRAALDVKQEDVGVLHERLQAMWKEMHIIERVRPIPVDPEKEPARADTRWRFSDNQMQLWIRVLQPLTTRRDENVGIDEAVRLMIPQMETLEGNIFERLVRLGWTEHLAMSGRTRARIDRGYWNMDGIEIDLLGYDEDERRLVLGSCKRSAKNHSPDKNLEGHIEDFLKTDAAETFRDWRQEKLLFSPEFRPDDRERLEPRGYRCVDIQDLAEMLGALSLHEPETVSRPYEDGFDF